jgi:hypothetical protein
VLTEKQKMLSVTMPHCTSVIQHFYGLWVLMADILKNFHGIFAIPGSHFAANELQIKDQCTKNCGDII